MYRRVQEQKYGTMVLAGASQRRCMYPYGDKVQLVQFQLNHPLHLHIAFKSPIQGISTRLYTPYSTAVAADRPPGAEYILYPRGTRDFDLPQQVQVPIRTSTINASSITQHRASDLVTTQRYLTGAKSKHSKLGRYH
jgi:hypothetical protein